MRSREDFDLRQQIESSDPDKGIEQHLAFDLDLRPVFEMLEVTAAAPAVPGAGSFDACRSGLENSDNRTARDTRSHLVDFDLEPVARRRALDKHHTTRSTQ
ncbi:MAG: hypothetical protein R2848_08850 [Thermomicrobiales bacterium]